MMGLRAWSALLTAGALVLAASLSAGACSPAQPQTDSQTNWLKSCVADSDCGELQCLCGVCVLSCSERSACDPQPATECFVASSRGPVAFCGGSVVPVAGLCLQRCAENADCAAGESCVAGACNREVDGTARVRVEVGARRQQLVGLGASIGYSYDEIVNHPKKSALFDAMFGGTGLTFLRLRNRFADGDTELLSTKEIVSEATKRLGRAPSLYLTSASPPVELKANGALRCSGNPDTCTLVSNAAGAFDYLGFGRYWRASVQAYLNAGLYLDYVALQNDVNWVPDASVSMEACKFLPREGTQRVTVDGKSVDVRYPGFDQALAAVQAQFRSLPAPPRIAAPEVTSVQGLAPYLPVLPDSAVGALAYHLYEVDAGGDVGAIFAQLARDLGTRSTPTFQTEMRADGMDTATLLHHTLASGAVVYLQNDFVASADSLSGDRMALVSLTRDDFVFELPYWAFAHYARFIAPGWTRVDAAVDRGPVLATAWLSPTGDDLTAVLVNPSLEDVPVALEFGAYAGRARVLRTTFDGEERLSELGALSTNAVVRLPAHSTVTVTTKKP